MPGLEATWEALRQWWVAQDDDIASFTTVAEFKHLYTREDIVYDSWNLLTEYEGLNLIKLLKVLRGAWENYRDVADTRDLATDFKDTSGKVTKFTYTNKEPFYKDIALCVYIFATRGSAWAKIENKSNASFQEVLKVLKEKFQISTVKRDGNTPLSPDTITLPRIASCFPMYLCEIFHLGRGKQLISLDSLGLNNECSKSVTCLSFVSMISKALVTSLPEVHFLIFLAHILVDDIVHDDGTPKTKLDKMLSYYTAAYRTIVMQDTRRTEFLKWVGILTVSNSVNVNFAQAAVHAEAKIRARRAEDPQLQVVLDRLRTLH